MKIITIPAEVTIHIPYRDSATNAINEVAQTSTFVHFLKQICNIYEGFTKGPRQARVYNKIMDILDSTAPNALSISFEDEDYKILQGAVDTAAWVSPKINRAYIPFYTAFEKAETVSM